MTSTTIEAQVDEAIKKVIQNIHRYQFHIGENCPNRCGIDIAIADCPEGKKLKDALPDGYLILHGSSELQSGEKE